MVHILVADDDHAIVSTVQRLLEALGYRVSSGGSIPDVRAAVARSTPDYVLLNIDLEGRGDGLALLPELAAQGIHIIIFSAYSEFEARRHWRLPELPYIQKPFRLDEFEDQIACFCPQDR